ncbi:MAG: stage III sporulation protein AE, partial [Oscillospiraceae bacterium]|nr:stage III sporulation protein AE [Oscillospiraceae bacterium]
YILLAALTVILTLLTPAAASAQSIDFGQDQLSDALTDSARDILDSEGITPDNSGAMNLSFTGVLGELWETVKHTAGKPLALLCSLCGVVLFCALAESVCGEGNMKGVLSAVGVLCGAGIATASVYEVLDSTLGLLGAAANFMLVFIPSFTAISAVIGHVSSATAVNSAALAATQLFSQLAVNFLAPLCGTIIGVSTAGAVHPQMKLDKLGELIKKFVVWGLTLIMTVFMSVLSAQTLVASAADNAAIKAAKFMVSQGVPIVGGTIADAVNTFGSSLTMLKSSVGTYGIIAVAAMIVPVLIGLLCYKAALTCSEYAAEMFGLKELTALLKSCGAVMTIIIAVTACFLLLNTLAAALLLAITGTV